ncbi:MAG: adenylate kinase, partial [Acidimicrobiia bacterium]
MRILFLGPPGAGKGTQAAKVAAELGIPHVSTGEMFRRHATDGTEIGRRAQAIMEAGDYVPDEVTIAMLEERIAQPDARDGFILDGFPRTGAQAEALDASLGEHGLDRVVLFEVDEDEIVERMLDRGRSDDTEEAIRTRLQVYRDQTEPLVGIYDARRLLTRVDGMGQPHQVTQRLLKVLGHVPPVGGRPVAPGMAKD